MESDTTITANPESTVAEVAMVLPAYHKCLSCPELGRTCGGQDITALGNTDTVRAFDRMIKAARKNEVTLSAIYEAAKQIGKTTINEYFSNADHDFKWTTVATIHSAVVAICGDRVGLPPPETPCPATFVSLRDRCDALSARLDEATAENAQLAEAVKAAEENAKTRLANQRADLDKIIELQQARIATLEAEKEDYLARNDEKRLKIEQLHEDIRTLNAQLIKMAADHAAEIRLLAGRVLDLSETK